MPEPVLTVSGLSVVAPRGRARRVVVEGWDLSVRPGESIALQGLAPADLSSILEAVAGLRPPAAGSVTVSPAHHEGARAHHRSRPIGYLPVEPQLVPALTAVENVALAFAATGGPPAHGWTRAERLLGELGLPPGAWHNLVEQLSGGQRQRVEVARGLVDHPALLVADNPTSELDPASAELVFGRLFAAVSDGAALILATDDTAAVQACTRVVSITPPSADPTGTDHN